MFGRCYALCAKITLVIVSLINMLLCGLYWYFMYCVYILVHSLLISISFIARAVYREFL